MIKDTNSNTIEKVKDVINHIYSDLHQLEQQVSQLERSSISRKTIPDPVGIFKFKKVTEMERYFTKRGYDYLNGR